MRVPVGRSIRAGPGDTIVVRGLLPPASKLGRLFVFASENGARFSPYVPNVASALMVDGRPQMLTPLSMRLINPNLPRELVFKVDIDGFFQVMQEIDAPDEPRARVKLTRTINPDLGWADWAKRKFMSWQTARHLL